MRECSLHIKTVLLNVGDKVHYIGSDLKILNDYGTQELTILAISLVSGITVCQSREQTCLVGVPCCDLQRLD